MQRIAIGTEKGAYFLEKNGGWKVDGPRFPGWKVSAFGRAPDGTYLAGLGSNWFGASVHRSEDFDKWVQVETGPSYPAELNRKLTQIWTFHTSGERVLAGVDQAGLFTSDDQGITWEPVLALNEHESRPTWEPGFGGLCAHHILTDGDRIWVGISAVGVFRSDDGGKSFGRFDQGVTPTGTPDEDGSGVNLWCVHGLVSDPANPDSIWRQDHMGVYRTLDGGETWVRIETGLPSRFGFTMRRHHASGTLFVVPLAADENRVPVDGRLAAYRSTDGGDSWNVAGSGWPGAEQFTGVLRNAMDIDADGSVAFGTTSGQVYISADVGEHWEQLPFSFPRILTVAVI
ncbi:MAG TPA: sialidase family protein [Acidimicrobiia bacterium]|nr:sialidase family protein [Acidimicrobiia bacterium]